MKTGAAWWNGPSELALSGTVHPSNDNTYYYFEYGVSTAYGQSAPLNLKGFAGDGGAERFVVQQAFDLATDTAYHYRLVAVNATGTAFGGDRIIAPQNQSQVYELVSDGESNGLGLLRLAGVSSDGERVALTAQTLGDPPSLPSQTNEFIAERGESGWTVPRLGPDPGQGSGAAIAAERVLDAEFGALLMPQRTTIEAMAQEARWTVSRPGGSSEPASPQLIPREWIAQLSNNQGAQFEFAGGAADFTTIFFKKTYDGTDRALTYVPGEPLVSAGYPENSTVSIYRVDGPAQSDLSLANVGPDGNPIANACGSWVGSDASSAPVLGHNLRPVSADGSVLYFSARPDAPAAGDCSEAARSGYPLRIYKRIGDASTVEVSACAKTSPAVCEAAGDDVFQGAAASGEQVFFTTSRQLTDSDSDSTSDLYLFDADPPPGEPAVVQVSAGQVTAGHPTVGADAGVQGVPMVSAGGTRVFFVAIGQLTDEATPGANNLFVYERSAAQPAGRIAHVAALAPGLLDQDLWGDGRAPEARAVPDGGAEDGRFLFFVSVAPLSGEDGDTATDLYRWDDAAGQLTCLSCAGDGEFSVSAGFPGNQYLPAYARESSIASEDGAAAVFATQEAIGSEDENNAAADVYLWRQGEGLTLVTGGTGATGSAFELGEVRAPLISADGERVFFITKAALHPADQNSAFDAYAASVGGGLPLPRPGASKCEDGQDCRGDAPAPSPFQSPPSESASGPGNVVPTPPKPCGGNRVRRGDRCVSKRALAKRACAKQKGKAKRRCIRKQLERLTYEKTAQRANNDRGGNR